MLSLKDIRNRIASVNSTRQITNAMKMVSAAKLKKAQDAIIHLRLYNEKLKDIMNTVCDLQKDIKNNIYCCERPEKKVLVVVLNSNRGLCGAFNQNVIHKVNQTANETYRDQFANDNLDFFIIGKKAEEALRKNIKIVNTRHDIFNNLNFEYVAEVAQEIMDQFTQGKYDRVDLIYNQFKNAGVQILIDEQYLPVKITAKKEDIIFTSKYEVFYDYIFEPSNKNIIQELLPKMLKIHFYKALLDSHASEHGARMTAMHKATDNASELLKELSLEYNKARQASITKEILEIVGGAEALNL